MSYPIPRATIWPNVMFDTCPVEPRDGEIDTQTHVDTQTATQSVYRKKVRAAEILNAAAEHAHRANDTQRRRDDRILYGDIERNLNA